MRVSAVPLVLGLVPNQRPQHLVSEPPTMAYGAELSPFAMLKAGNEKIMTSIDNMMAILQETWAVMVKLKEQEEASRAIAMLMLPSPSSTALPTPPQWALPLVAPLVRRRWRKDAAVQWRSFPHDRPMLRHRQHGAQRLREQRRCRVLPAIVTLHGNKGVTAPLC